MDFLSKGWPAPFSRVHILFLISQGCAFACPNVVNLRHKHLRVKASRSVWSAQLLLRFSRMYIESNSMWYRKLEPKMWRYELRYHRIVFAMFFRKAQQELRTPNALRSLILRQLRLKLMTLFACPGLHAATLFKGRTFAIVSIRPMSLGSPISPSFNLLC